MASLPPVGSSPRPPLRLGTPAGTVEIGGSGEIWITALPTVALSAVRAGAPTAIALTLDAPIAGDGTSEATEADSDGTEHRDDAEGQEETPATAHSPPAASPSAAEVEAMRAELAELRPLRAMQAR